MRTKSQTATEYMVILAIVVIIALILATILGDFPGMGSAMHQRGSSAFWQSGEIGIVAYSIADDASNDDVVLELRNNMKDAVIITSIEFDGSEIYGTDFVLSSGEKRTLDIDGAGSFCLAAGDTYTVDVNISYTDDRTGESFFFDGGGVKLEGKCAN